METSLLGLRTTIYKVSDIEAAREWYTKVLGVEPYFNETYYVGFSIKGYELGLQAEEASKGENVATFWGVENIQAEYDRFVSLGATPVEAPISVGGDIQVATVKDPWENIIGLIYNPGFTTVQ